MTVEISDYPNVDNRAAEIGCRAPTDFAILPKNFPTAKDRSELLFDAHASTLRKVLKAANLPVQDVLPPGERIGAVVNKHFEWAAPLFIGSGVLMNNPQAISAALQVISDLATDALRGIPRKDIKLSIVVENKKKRCKRLDYEGGVEGISELKTTIEKIFTDE